jgi:hypothetical protein
MKVLVGSLLPNPFDKGSLDPEVVVRLQESIRLLPDRVRLEVRKSSSVGYWECVDGKHRVAAIKAECGQLEMVEVELKDLSDKQMFLGWIYLNFARRTAGDVEWRMLVEQAKQYLIANPTECTRQVSTAGHLQGSKGCQTGEHGSSRCISVFLGIEGLSFQKVARLLSKNEEVQKEAVKQRVEANVPTSMIELPTEPRARMAAIIENETRRSESFEAERQAIIHQREQGAKAEVQKAQDKKTRASAGSAVSLVRSLQSTHRTYSKRFEEDLDFYKVGELTRQEANSLRVELVKLGVLLKKQLDQLPD